MTLLDTITYRSTANAHRPCPRVIVADEGWRQAIDQLVAGRCTLLGLWGDANAVHMALLEETTVDIAVLSYTCEAGTYPSVAAHHPPAIRLERAVHDLFGLEAVGTPDARPWLDLGFWSVRHPLGDRGPCWHRSRLTMTSLPLCSQDPREQDSGECNPSFPRNP